MYDLRSSREEEERESYNQRQKKKSEREAEGKRARGYVGSSNRQPDRDGREQDPHAVIGCTKRDRSRSRSPVTRKRSSSPFSCSPSPKRQKLKIKQRGRSRSPGDKRHSHTIQDERRGLEHGDEFKRKYCRDQYENDDG